MSVIRAKFRCLGINLKWDGSSTAELKPVTKKKYEYGKEAMNFAENEQFWKYSPSGECSLGFKTTDIEKLPVRLGSYYYIDMEQDDAGEWELSTISNYGAQGAGEVYFSVNNSGEAAEKLHFGTLKIGLSGESAKVSHFGATSKKWKITFSLAHDHTIES